MAGQLQRFQRSKKSFQFGYNITLPPLLHLHWPVNAVTPYSAKASVHFPHIQFSAIDHSKDVSRNAKGTFASTWVYPGGAVDEIDTDPCWNTLPLNKGVEERYRSYAVAAIRETFEECGLLLTTPKVSRMTPAESEEWRHKVHNDASSFAHLCQHLRTQPSLHSLVRWAHWITPTIEKKRFDTQFFLTVLPEPIEGGTLVDADGKETLSLEWLSPQSALEAFREKRIRLFPPQYLTLLELSRMTLRDLRGYVSGERKRGVIEPTMPEPYMADDDGLVLLLPGDALHSTAAARVPMLLEGTKRRVKVERDEKGIAGIKLIESSPKTVTSSKL
ncbi:hypothetical protein HDV05_003671 [Chytridiales sp. JEL 0842]|nr:hypothetical protein HDV05_003671 [Chytridiales sp. JEL 0842]